jgi:DNA primase
MTKPKYDIKKLITDRLKADKNNYVQSGKDFIMCSCLNPKHKDAHPSFAINLTNGYGKCFSCGFSVSSSYFTKDLPSMDAEELERAILYNTAKEKLSGVDTPVEFKESFLPPIDKFMDMYRCISKETLQRAGVYLTTREGRYQDRIIFPVYYEDKLIGFTGRTTNSDVLPKYLHSTGLATKHVVYPYNIIKAHKHKRLFVTEGVMDALSMIDMGYNAMCNFGVADNFTNKKVAELVRLGVEELYLCFDKDEAGAEQEVKILQNLNLKFFDKVGLARTLPEFKEYYQSPAKDFNEYLVLKKLGVPFEPSTSILDVPYDEEL